MTNRCNYVGFVGVDKHDIILYLSRILIYLGKKVLIVDRNEAGALTSCIPYPKELDKFVVEYQNTYFINSGEGEDNLGESIKTLEIDYVLVDYGFKEPEQESSLLNRVVYVTDQQRHNLEKLLSMVSPLIRARSLVIRDAVGNRSELSVIMNEYELSGVSMDKAYFIYQDELDTKCKIRCQSEATFNFKRLSSPVQNMIKSLIQELIPELEKNIINTAYRKAEKGY